MPDFPKNSPFYISSAVRPARRQRQHERRPRARHHFGQAQGSGFFISADGYIVTNNHVVDHATEVTITTADGKTMPAKVIGTDTKTDLALLKVEGDNFPSSTSPRRRRASAIG